MKILRKFFCSVFFCILSFSALKQIQAYAETYQIIEAKIPVSCFGVEDGQKMNYEIVMEAESQSPAPKSEILEIIEGDTETFQILIDEPGVFPYKVYEIPGTEPNIQYDSTVYHVSVYVEEAQPGILSYAVAVTANDSGRKPDKIEFRNHMVLDDTNIRTTPASSGETPEHASRSTTVTTTVTTDTTMTPSETAAETVPKKPEQKPPTMINSIREFFSPLTGDTFSAGILSLMLILGFAGILLSVKKQNREGGQNHEDEEENQG